jgi:hypothetical protein
MEVVPVHFSGNPDPVFYLCACRRRVHMFRQRNLGARSLGDPLDVCEL